MGKGSRYKAGEGQEIYPPQRYWPSSLALCACTARPQARNVDAKLPIAVHQPKPEAGDFSICKGAEVRPAKGSRRDDSRPRVESSG